MFIKLINLAIKRILKSYLIVEANIKKVSFTFLINNTLLTFSQKTKQKYTNKIV